MATKEQLRKMRQKYGLGEYRNKSSSVKARGTKMAKKRYFGRAYRKVKHTASKLPAEMIALSGAGYGFVRPMIANKIPNIPFVGSYSDNLVLGGLAYLGAKKTKGMLKNISIAVLASETFIVGTKLNAQTGFGAQTQSSGQSIVYL